MGKAKKSQSTRPKIYRDSSPDSDLQGENGWVIVKKQRVTILVPPIPVAERVKTHPKPKPNPESRQRSETLKRAVFNRPLSRRLRATNVGRKVKRAGGLGRWLESIGLGRFEGMFKKRGFGEFHLAGLTMKKLEEMGAVAVGPRRKLIHAIDCVCHPYCFHSAL